MGKKMNLDAFGEIIDRFLTENDVYFLLTMPKGTQEVQIQDSVGLGLTVQFFAVLNSIKAVCKTLREDLGIDAASPEWEHTVNVMLTMVKKDILGRDEK